MGRKQPLLIISDGDNVNDIFHIASAYNRAGRLIDDESVKTDDYSFIFPSIVCQSFAIELFLKFFIYFDKKQFELEREFSNKSKLGHKFTNLWDKVSDTYKNEISVHYTNASKINTSPNEMRSLLIKVDENSFVTWRYPYENKGFTNMHIDDIKLISDVLHSASYQVIKKTNPHY